ncbi:acetoacetate decarboxylase family protein [Sphingobium sp. CR2-8]|uniref:acetoacetate decarboxylase family protein n=1 Tax=Sphingobium sp. CR2-8 TaxID=1306534 RepID=UPI002DBA1A73|nr:acetoacetate decarboxylase family protein [Sphingobium sp. CR2-8]MEC3909390.1 acetoacetate decarboxylase family protein [Sphingobium sp. CR2-8]
MSADRLRLYGDPPFKFRGTRSLLVIYAATKEDVAPYLPPQLQPADNPIVVFSVMDCPDVSGLGPHIGGCLSISAKYNNEIGNYVSWLVTDTEASLIGFRETYGWPAIFGSTVLEERNGLVTARIERGGKALLNISVQVSGDVITEFAESDSFLLKDIPSSFNPLKYTSRIIATRSHIHNIKMRAGSGTLHFEPIPEIGLLAPPVGQMLTALYGTWDDIYPVSARILD